MRAFYLGFNYLSHGENFKEERITCSPYLCVFEFCFVITWHRRPRLDNGPWNIWNCSLPSRNREDESYVLRMRELKKIEGTESLMVLRSSLINLRSPLFGFCFIRK